MLRLIKKHHVDIISIGNGTASKETEMFTAETIKEADHPVYYMVVSEAGASVYSASKLAATELPDLDLTLRSAVSIARRLRILLQSLLRLSLRQSVSVSISTICRRKNLVKHLTVL